MFKVENVTTSIDQKLTHAWNCSNIKVTYRVSLFSIKGNSIVQLKQFNCSIEDKSRYSSGGTKVNEKV